MISIEEFEQRLQVGVTSGKITQAFADNEVLRRRQWLAGQQMAAFSAPADPSGPGTKLKALLAKIGIVPAPGCSCLKRAAHMDAMGSEWCGQNINEIVGWLREEHKKTKTVLPFIDSVARSLVRLAVRLSRDTKR